MGFLTPGEPVSISPSNIDPIIPKIHPVTAIPAYFLLFKTKVYDKIRSIPARNLIVSDSCNTKLGLQNA